MNYEQWLAAVCIWREARGQSTAVKTAIWHVIQNRVADPKRRWPKSISGVITQKMQFDSMTAPKDVNLIAWPVEPLAGIPGHASPDWAAFLDCQAVVESALNADPTNGANMYESEPIELRPSWTHPDKSVMTLDLGNTRFYTLF
jgi:hypothetical protein